MQWAVLLFAMSKLPVVYVTFENSDDASNIGLPISFTTTITNDWATYDCSNVASPDDTVVCERKQVVCLPGTSEIINNTRADEFHLMNRTPPPTPVPIKIV